MDKKPLLVLWLCPKCRLMQGQSSEIDEKIWCSNCHDTFLKKDSSKYVLSKCE
jgi:hypothetical protein